MGRSWVFIPETFIKPRLQWYSAFLGKTIHVYKEMYSRKSGVYGLPDSIINTSANMAAPLQKVVRDMPNSYLKKFPGLTFQAVKTGQL